MITGGGQLKQLKSGERKVDQFGRSLVRLGPKSQPAPKKQKPVPLRAAAENLGQVLTGVDARSSDLSVHTKKYPIFWSHYVSSFHFQTKHF